MRRRAHIELVWALLTGCNGMIEDLGDGERRITIDARLVQRDRRAVLAHELVHDERGVLFTDDTPTGIVRKEEAWVRAETARRLVPLHELDERVTTAVDDGEGVTASDVVEWFDVPDHVATEALEQLERRRARGRHPTRPRCWD